MLRLTDKQSSSATAESSVTRDSDPAIVRKWRQVPDGELAALQAENNDLRKRLADCEENLYAAATVGQNLLEDYERLRERLKEAEALNRDSESTPRASSSEQLRMLENDFDSLTSSMEKFVGKLSPSNSPDASPELGKRASIRQKVAPRTPRRLTTNKPMKPQSPRKNAMKGPTFVDPTLASDIDNQLLHHVRSLQQELGLSNEERRELQDKVVCLESELEGLRKQYDKTCSTGSKLDDKVWDLELHNQQLKDHIAKAEADYLRLKYSMEHTESAYRECLDLIEVLKSNEQKNVEAFEQSKARLEGELMRARRTISLLEREKSDLSQTCEKLAREAEETTFPRPEMSPRSSRFFPTVELDDTPSSPVPSSMPSSPERSPSKHTLFVESLSASLSLAHDQIRELEDSAERSKAERLELMKLLAQAQETIEAFQGKGTSTPEGGMAEHVREQLRTVIKIVERESRQELRPLPLEVDRPETGSVTADDVTPQLRPVARNLLDDFRAVALQSAGIRNTDVPDGDILPSAHCEMDPTDLHAPQSPSSIDIVLMPAGGERRTDEKRNGFILRHGKMIPVVEGVVQDDDIEESATKMTSEKLLEVAPPAVPKGLLNHRDQAHISAAQAVEPDTFCADKELRLGTTNFNPSVSDDAITMCNEIEPENPFVSSPNGSLEPHPVNGRRIPANTIGKSTSTSSLVNQCVEHATTTKVNGKTDDHSHSETVHVVSRANSCPSLPMCNDKEDTQVVAKEPLPSKLERTTSVPSFPKYDSLTKTSSPIAISKTKPLKTWAPLPYTGRFSPAPWPMPPPHPQKMVQATPVPAPPLRPTTIPPSPTPEERSSEERTEENPLNASTISIPMPDLPAPPVSQSNESGRASNETHREEEGSHSDDSERNASVTSSTAGHRSSLRNSKGAGISTTRRRSSAMRRRKSMKTNESNIFNTLLKNAKSASSLTSVGQSTEERETTASKDDKKKNDIECLTYTMIGSWFQKFNRHNRNPQLRYFWVNPYSRALNWAPKPPSQGKKNMQTKTAFIVSLKWDDPDRQYKNYPPGPEHALVIQTPHRTVRIVPTNWYDHGQWVGGLTLLLQRTHRPRPLHEQFGFMDKDGNFGPDIVHGDDSIHGSSLGSRQSIMVPKPKEDDADEDGERVKDERMTFEELESGPEPTQKTEVQSDSETPDRKRGRIGRRNSLWSSMQSFARSKPNMQREDHPTTEIPRPTTIRRETSGYDLGQEKPGTEVPKRMPSFGDLLSGRRSVSGHTDTRGCQSRRGSMVIGATTDDERDLQDVGAEKEAVPDSLYQFRSFFDNLAASTPLKKIRSIGAMRWSTTSRRKSVNRSMLSLDGAGMPSSGTQTPVPSGARSPVSLDIPFEEEGVSQNSRPEMGVRTRSQSFSSGDQLGTSNGMSLLNLNDMSRIPRF
ncbi:hypothetical protein, variant [Spizellomyces punctatus DAOM BR117]|uniref:Pleckstrin homology domain-containing protein n=1 Tax=Spizellomyces punctatus (strain DAOM BR117) TaxID=645134 RepID=A0A0L0HBX2_SPIPD|nr:hypothetical protein, variant [Spizellomyces punctatus DAOM BR117]KNC98682.1 hypothetical protein, variant [Spizellomyces punctatus DAOM BR117]|eukprot:XP_016606722.1 hypothetical protein, variant [Spizellomyces punctatus DAOM BR117]